MFNYFGGEKEGGAVDRRRRAEATVCSSGHGNAASISNSPAFCCCVFENGGITEKINLNFSYENLV